MYGFRLNGLVRRRPRKHFAYVFARILFIIYCLNHRISSNGSTVIDMLYRVQHPVLPNERVCNNNNINDDNENVQTRNDLF